ncbi:hypothetical protein LCGC14_1944440 [marine sediment metagenome]|uniref:SMODS-associated and fused to various effectors domain-containing protein n=1 Tax=marine sediment metagenome TaxID=412755 RepID=A0A0F9G7R4_9ZZZZ
MNPRVFVTQETRHNYSQAERYGEIVFCSWREFSKHSQSKGNNDIIQGMNKIMEDFRSEEDWILPSGSPIAIGLAFIIAADKGSSIKILSWDNMVRQYHEVKLQLN